MDEPIKKFLAERLSVWLKGKIKPDMDEEEIEKWTTEGNNKFSRNQWLPDAAKRARQLSMVSHPSKFSHPNAQASSVIVLGRFEADGYLRSGNVDYEQDVLGNAAALDVYKFLTIKMADGQTVLTHLEKDSEEIQQALRIESTDYTELKQGFLAIKQETDTIYTDRLIKQVYFPLDDKNEYHLLSILTPSGLVTRLKSDIEKIRFSEETKAARASRKDNKFHETGYDDIYDLTIIGYGGTKPQNISVLNNQNAGRAYLLPSTPPILKKRKVVLPRNDFFENTLSYYYVKDSFISLHRLMSRDTNNKPVRNSINNILKFIIESVLAEALKIRNFEAGWTEKEYYADLPSAQKIWLDNARTEERENDDTWLEEISNTLARWIIYGYKTTLETKKIILGDNELSHIAQQAQDNIKQVKEFFR